MSAANRAKFVVIEGTDGSGKGTQARLLASYLKKKKIPFELFDFPQYGKTSAYFVEKFLRGEYENSGKDSAKRNSIFFALDRFDASEKIREAINSGKFVLANRYLASNMGHQGARMNSRRERKAYFKWLYELEYEIFGIPKPDLNVFLHVPVKISKELILKKEAREYLKGGKKDIHERDDDHLKRAERVYLELIDLFPKDFQRIDCAPKGKLLSIEDVHALILERLSPL